MAWKLDTSFSSVVEWILSNLGVKTTDEINEWFRKSRNAEYHIHGLSEAIDLFQKNKQKHIVICGDYDADGIMAISILMLALKQAGFCHLHYMIPHRHTEGYGLNMRMVEEIHEKYQENVCLVTVDNGIVAFDELRKAKEYGWDILVTDHHIGKTDENGDILLPTADVIIDPAFLPNTADFSGYCGAGLAYRIAMALLGHKNSKYLMPLAAIATFADVVPLHEENYVFARDGLRLLNEQMAPEGLNSLIKANRLEIVEDTTILFQIAPEINAPGRLNPNGAEMCVDLMLADKFTAFEMATRVIGLNDKRKTQVTEALQKIKQEQSASEKVLVYYLPGINPGIIGIIAGQITEERKLPTIVFTDNQSNETQMVGSCRSTEALHMKNFLDSIQEHIAAYGGHAGAAGIKIEKSKWTDFIQAVSDKAKDYDLTLQNEDNQFYQAEISNKYIRKELENVNRFAPFGEGNPKPIFKVKHFNALPNHGEFYRILAKEGVKFTSNTSNAIAFGIANQMEKYNKEKFQDMSFYGTLSFNHFRGISTPQIEFKEFSLANSEQ